MRILAKALSGTLTHPAASWRLFAVFLTTMFVVEAVVMGTLPHLISATAPTTISALVDAALLTAVLAPLVWWLFIRPVQRIHKAQGRLLEAMVRAQEQERMRISRDLHDGLGQELTAILIRLRVLEDQVQDPAVQDNVAAIRAATVTALDDLRRVVRETRPPVLDDLGLAAALEKMLADVGEATGMDMTLSWNAAGAARLPNEVEVALYRIIQEAVTNAVKHSRGTRVLTSITIEEAELKATVSDDGTGFDPKAVLSQPGRAFGLPSMQARAEHLYGSVSISSRPRNGTVVAIRIPLPPTHRPPPVDA